MEAVRGWVWIFSGIAHWAIVTVGRKSTVFALVYFVFEGNFQVQAPGGLIYGEAM